MRQPVRVGHIAGGVALVGFGMACLWVLLTVTGLRAEWKTRAGWLDAAAGVEALLARDAPDLPRAARAYAELDQAIVDTPGASPAVLEAAGRVRGALAAPGTSPTAAIARLQGLTTAISAENAETWEDLGAMWRASFALAFVGLVLGVLAWWTATRQAARAHALDAEAARLVAVDERHALALGATEDGVFDWNLLTNELFATDRFAAMLGTSASRVDGVKQWLDRIHPKDRDVLLDQVQRVRDHKLERVHVELRVRADDGHIHWMSVRAAPVLNRLGDAVRLVGAQSDVTSRREAERTRVEMVAGVGARLVDPLEQLTSGLRAVGASADPNDIGRMERAVGSIRALVDELRDLAAIESGALELRREPVSLGQIVGEVVRLSSAFTGARAVTVVLGRHDDAVVVGDRLRIGRVLGDLVANAVARSPRGGRVTIDVHDAGGAVRLLVTDQGTAPVDVQQWVHLDASMTGTGLAISRDVVHRMGGRLGVKSNDVGATFWFELLRVDTATGTPAPSRLRT